MNQNHNDFLIKLSLINIIVKSIELEIFNILHYKIKIKAFVLRICTFKYQKWIYMLVGSTSDRKLALSKEGVEILAP